MNDYDQPHAVIREYIDASRAGNGWQMEDHCQGLYPGTGFNINDNNLF